MRTLLSNIQHNLEEIYEISVPEDIFDFVTTDKYLAELISNKKIHDKVLEQLLVAADDNHLGVSLYLDDELVKRVDKNHSIAKMTKNSLHEFWVVLEGVSHFLYLAWNASYNRPVTKLELELQAEIDKFVSASNVLDENCGLSELNEIWKLLFTNQRFYNHLEQKSLERYRKANAYASQYCLNLIEKYKHKTASINNELRRFYRLKHTQKLSYINNTEISFCP